MKRRPWTTSEVSYLLENAGSMPKREICRHLRRSGKSVERKAHWLRERGHAVCLRFFEPSLSACPKCGRMSGTIGRDGFCEPCARRAQLDAVNARISELWPLLSQRDRATYEQTEAETDASRHDAMPPAPDVTGMDRYHRCKAEESHARELEAWETRYLMREIKRVQKRKERIEKKVKLTGVSPETPDGRTIWTKREPGSSTP